MLPRLFCTQLVNNSLLGEIALKQAVESLAVACFVLAHLVYGVMHGIITQLFGPLGNHQLAIAGSELGLGAHLHILRCAVGEHFAQKFGKLCCMLGFFEGIASEGLSYFGVSLSLGLTAHGQVHANLAALARKIVAQTLHNLRIQSFCYTYAMLISVYFLGAFLNLYECVYSAYRADFRHRLALDYFAADGALVLFHIRVCLVCLFVFCAVFLLFCGNAQRIAE